ncbi:TonB-dependent receptor [bacterium]|nr:TonB-dependent receptor [bacterium]
MKILNLTPIVLAVVLALFSLNPATAQESEQGKTGTIKGIVVNSSTNQPLAGANIIVEGSPYGAATDLDGKFEIANVPTGTYAVRASVLGYQPVTYSDVVVTPTRPATLTFNLVQMEISLEEVTVSAGYFQTAPDKPVSTTVQSNEEIRRLPGGFEDVVRAVSILPGVAQVSPGRNDLIVRGGAPSENLFVIDNIKVPNINHFGTQGSTGGPQSYINLDFVDQTRFATGGFGVRYGDKLSSVLSIDLREGRDDRFGGKGTISASLFGINLEGPVSDKGSYLFSARRSYLDFIFKAAGFGFVPEYWDYLGKVTYNISPRDRINVLAIAAIDRIRLINDTEDQRFDNSRILAPEQDNVIGGVSWRRLFNGGYSTLTFGQSWVRYESEQRDSLLNPIFRNNSIEHETSLRNDLTFQLTPLTEFTTGIEGKLINFNADLVLDTVTTSFGETFFKDDEYDTTGVKAAAYAQISHRFSYLRWTIGARADYFDMIENSTAVSPRLSLSYPLTSTTNINGSVGRFYQAPAYIWLVGNPENRKLDFIGVNQYILGVENLPRKDVRLNLEFYNKDYFDYPVSIDRPYLIMLNTGTGYGGRSEGFASYGLDHLISDGSGWARGIELSAQKRLSEIPWYGLFSLSYNWNKFRALDGIERPSQYDQRWIFNMGGGYILDDKWEFAGKFRMVTGRPYTPFESDGSQLPERYNTARVGTYHTLDLRVDRRWYMGNKVLISYIDVQNVYNSKSQEPPEWNRRLNAPDSQDGIGLLPSIGLSLEF